MRLAHSTAAQDRPDFGQEEHGLGSSGPAGTTSGACKRSLEYLIRRQFPEGYWWAELESNATMTAEYVMLFHLLGCVNRDRERKLVRYLRHQQTKNGSWELYFQDGGDLSTTVEAYFALKLAGEDTDREPLKRARTFIVSHGGVERTRVFTKIWLALFSQYAWDRVPSMPVEMILLPSWSPFNIYEFSSWARSTVVPLTITLAHRPSITLPPETGIRELFVRGKSTDTVPSSPVKKFFFLIDRLLKRYEQRPLRALRRKAVVVSERWILEHQEESGDWGGIQPPMVYGLLALHQLGYGLDHPVMARGLRALERFCTEDERGLSLQACVSPVWDTSLNALALLDAGISPDHPAILKAGRWLAQNQVCCGGDWQVKNRCAPGGWAFEFANNKYPDVDDTAVVLMVLHRLHSGSTLEPAIPSCIERGLRWCLSMQSSGGGWAAFDRDNTKMILNKIPFADQEAMVDYPTADITGRVLEAMGVLGYGTDHPQARGGIAFIRSQQEKDGAWWGRWGVNYIYGTWSVLRGLAAIGEDMSKPYIQRAARWLQDHQNQDGGWGESCASYNDPRLGGRGPSTASQTAWAVMGLIAAGHAAGRAVRRGIDYLIRTQLADGSWQELAFTGTGFPKHFFIRYHNYRNCFPLMALGQYLRAAPQERAR